MSPRSPKKGQIEAEIRNRSIRKLRRPPRLVPHERVPQAAPFPRHPIARARHVSEHRSSGRFPPLLDIPKYPDEGVRPRGPRPPLATPRRRIFGIPRHARIPEGARGVPRSSRPAPRRPRGNVGTSSSPAGVRGGSLPFARGDPETASAATPRRARLVVRGVPLDEIIAAN